jgi:hypothetical protein
MYVASRFAPMPFNLSHFAFQDSVCVSNIALCQDRRFLKYLGKAFLCGILQVAYSTCEGPVVRYTIGVLYRTHLMLARPTVDTMTQKAVCAVSLLIPLIELASGDIQGNKLSRSSPPQVVLTCYCRPRNP